MLNYYITFLLYGNERWTISSQKKKLEGTDVALQNCAENSLLGTCEKLESFKENGNKRNSQKRQLKFLG